MSCPQCGSEKQPRELYALCILFMVVSNIIWNAARIDLELKLTFTFLLFCMFLTFMFVFVELEKLEVKNI